MCSTELKECTHTNTHITHVYEDLKLLDIVYTELSKTMCGNMRKTQVSSGRYETPDQTGCGRGCDAHARTLGAPQPQGPWPSKSRSSTDIRRLTIILTLRE